MTIRISYLILLRILLLDLTPLIIRINTTLCKILLLLLFRYSFVSIFELFITAMQERSTSTLYSHLFFLLRIAANSLASLLMHFTPKTYYYLAGNFSAWRISLARHWFIVLTLRIRNWCPQCLGKLLSFLLVLVRITQLETSLKPIV